MSACIKSCYYLFVDCWVDEDYILSVEIFVVFILMRCKIIQSTSDCLCFKLGSLYFIKTSIGFSLLKKVEKKSPQIFSFFGPKYQNHRHSPQFLNLLKSSWKFSSVLNFHKGQLHCTQYYFFKYCSFKFETVSSRLLPLHICST